MVSPEPGSLSLNVTPFLTSWVICCRLRNLSAWTCPCVNRERCSHLLHLNLACECFLWTHQVADMEMLLSRLQVHCVFCLFVLGSHSRHMEAPRQGVKPELQLAAYTTATATPDPSRICDLHHSSWQCRILNPLSETRDQTRNLLVPSQSR